MENRVDDQILSIKDSVYNNKKATYELNKKPNKQEY